jgi:hypothetical protein
MEDKQPNKKNAEKAEKNIRCTITLEPGDYRVVVRYGRQIGLDPRNFSAALGMFIREWSRLARPEPRFKFLHSLTRPKEAQSQDLKP